MLVKPLTVFLAIFVAVTACLIFYFTQPAKIGGDFTLKYRDQAWTLSDHARPLNLFYMGYVKCPDVCPMSLSASGQAFTELSDSERKNVQLTFLSVDIAHDTPQSVAEYASQFFPEFIGLTGTAEEIKKTVDLFQASFVVEKAPKTYLGYSISHTDRLFFLDKRGKVIDSISSPRTKDEILTKIRGHL